MTVRWSNEYAGGQRRGADYWPMAVVSFFMTAFSAAIIAGLVTMSLASAAAPKQQYAEGAGLAVLLLGVAVAAVAGLASATALSWLLVIRPLRKIRRNMIKDREPNQPNKSR